MNATMFVVRGFHQGRKLRSQYFGTQEQARRCADLMTGAVDCIVLAVTTRTSITQRRAASMAAMPST